jgi:Protein of unknown function (DUF2934)
MARSEKPQSMNDSERTVGVTMLADGPPTDGTEHEELEEQIRTRAYELYLERGAEPNDDLGNWLQAEREYRGRSRDERSDSADAHDRAR